MSGLSVCGWPPSLYSAALPRFFVQITKGGVPTTGGRQLNSGLRSNLNLASYSQRQTLLYIRANTLMWKVTLY